jgi:hypothetical protein
MGVPCQLNQSVYAIPFGNTGWAIPCIWIGPTDTCNPAASFTHNEIDIEAPLSAAPHGWLCDPYPLSSLDPSQSTHPFGPPTTAVETGLEDMSEEEKQLLLDTSFPDSADGVPGDGMPNNFGVQGMYIFCEQR